MRLFGREGEAERARALELRCEACGYPLGTLGALERCPECGRATALSDPARREGSAWQRRGGAIGLAASGAMVLWRPRRFWDAARVDAASGLWLVAWHALLAALLGCAPLLLDRREWGGWALFAGLVAGSATLVLALTLIEALGIRFWGRVHGFRVTRAVAWTICGHAAIGWTLGGALAAGGWLLGQRISERGPRAIELWFVAIPTEIAAPVLIAAGGAFGLLVFETLTYLGVRRMRFANAPGAGAR